MFEMKAKEKYFGVLILNHPFTEMIREIKASVIIVCVIIINEGEIAIWMLQNVAFLQIIVTEQNRRIGALYLPQQEGVFFFQVVLHNC